MTFITHTALPFAFISSLSMYPATKPTTIRPLVPEDCQQLGVFIRQYSGGLQQFNHVFLLHHAASVWMAFHTDQQQLLGVIISWQSPSKHSTAVVESIVLHPEAHRQSVATALLETAIHYWQQQCIRQLTAPAFPHNHWLAEVFAQAGFNERITTPVPSISKTLQPVHICLHNKRMRPRINSANGQVDEATLFEYFQDGDFVWGTYSGGVIERGVLVGKMNAKRNIHFHYMQIDKDGQMGQGHSKSSTEFLKNGRIALYEDWQWSGNRTGSGTAIIEEVDE